MIKNKTKAGMILIYTDEYGNQKAIEPKDLKVKLDNGFETQLGLFIEGAIEHDEKVDKQLKALNTAVKDLTKALELQHAQLVLDNQEIELLKKKIGGNK